MRMISGIQPSGRLHLGNWWGSIRQWVALQAEHEMFVFIADLHAMNTVGQGARLAELTAELAGDLLALGIDPAASCLFVQSQVAAHSQLAWVLGTLAPMAWLERAHSYKDKLARGQRPNLGLFSYPVLQAADILLYRAEGVPVGPDQRQHIEMARDLAVKFNLAHVPGYDANAPADAGILRPPQAHVVLAAPVPGLDGQKMSKSYDNTLELFGEEAQLRRRIMRMVTDSTPQETPKPEAGPLWELLMLICPPDGREGCAASWRAGGTGYGTFKARLAEMLLDLLAPLRARRRQLAERPGAIAEALQEGGARARREAAVVWERVAAAVGLTATGRTGG